MDRIILPTPDGPTELDVISLPASAFSDLRAWDALATVRSATFVPVELDSDERQERC